VLRAFAAVGAPRPLAGGRQTAWRAGDVVLKPLDMSPEALRWQAGLLAGLAGRSDFRVAVPRRARDGSLVVDGWTAWPFLDGEHTTGRWPEVVAVGERFHAAVRGCARPAFLAARDDHWAVADRVAWGELDPAAYRHVRHVAELSASLRPVYDRDQVVHGDLTGNVLFHPRLPPAVIDLSAYWRPAAFGTAVVVADALVWHGAGESLVRAAGAAPHVAQYLLRALIFRRVAEHLAGWDGPGDSGAAGDPYLPAVALACALAV
jgi:uncharacterized protein (TIGR02569 family)